jgi:hypothetical protein
VDCTAIQAVNPQIAALSQHQDPASENAAEINKAIVLELAAQIAAVGGDPLEALQSGTFEPGDVNDPTGAGNTCNDETDLEGCIFTENLLVPDVSEEEILAAVGGAGAGAADEAAANVDANKEAQKANEDKKADAQNKDAQKANDDEKADAQNKDAQRAKGNAAAKRFKQQAVQNINLADLFQKHQLVADIGINAQFVLNQQQFQQQLLQFQQIDAQLIQQQFATLIQQIQFNAWQQIAIQEFVLQQQLLQQQIQQQAFAQQLQFFQQQIVQNVAVVVQQHVQILQQNANVVQLGGFEALQQGFVQQLGGLSSFANLLNLGGGVQKFAGDVQLQKLFGGKVGQGFF